MITDRKLSVAEAARQLDVGENLLREWRTAHLGRGDAAFPGAGLLAHSDRGSPYASDHDQRAPASDGIVCSMSGGGPCWGNAPVESFFGSLKRELAPDEVFGTREQARAAIFEYLDVFDNRVRRHSSLGLVSPEVFERTYHQTHR